MAEQEDMTWPEGPCIPVISERVRDAAALGRPIYAARDVRPQTAKEEAIVRGLHGILEKGMLYERHWDYFLGNDLSPQGRAYMEALYALRDDDDSVCSADWLAETNEAEWTLFCAAVEGNAEALAHYAELKQKYAEWDRLRGEYEGH